MNNKADIFNELKELSGFLLHLKENEMNPDIPAGYFDSLSDEVLHKITIFEEIKSLSPLLSDIKMSEVKPVVPVNYFLQLSDSMMSMTQVDNTVLSPFNKQNLEIPADYFESLADTVLSKIKAEEKIIGAGKIISLQPQRRNTIRFFSRIAVAASVIGIIIFGIKNFHKTITPVNNCEDGIACLTQDEIYNYMNVHSHEFEMQQVQETVQPFIEKTDPQIDINKIEAKQYIEQNKNGLDVEDASADIF